MLVIILGMGLSACTTKAKDPVMDWKVISDIKSSLSIQDGFVEFKTVEITDKEVDKSNYTIKAAVSYYRYDALLITEVILLYTKTDSTWSSTSLNVTVISSQAFRAPVLPEPLNDFMRLYLNPFYKTYFTDSNFGLGFDEIVDTKLDSINNKATFTIRSYEHSFGLWTANGEATLEATYHYPGEWTYDVTREQFSEQVAWEGTYLIELGKWVGKTFTATESFEMTFHGSITLQALAGGDETIVNDARVTFTLDGQDYEVLALLAPYGDGRTNIKRLTIDYGVGQYDYFEIEFVEEWQNNEIVPVLKIWHGMQAQKITKIQ